LGKAPEAFEEHINSGKKESSLGGKGEERVGETWSCKFLDEGKGTMKQGEKTAFNNGRYG